MTERVFDDLARRLAQPMPRRRALRLIGASVAVTAFPLLRPKRAGAQRFCGPSIIIRESCGLCPGDRPLCCPWSSPGAVSCCSPNTTCDGQGRCCVPCPSGTTECGTPGDAQCCSSNQECVDGTCWDKCPTGGPRCGRNCCARGERCQSGRCVKSCPPGRALCRGKCCPKGQYCSGGRCSKCPSGRKSCGKKCCAKGQDCCSDGPTNICCDTKRRACCPVGPPDREKMTCCPAGQRCARVLELSPGGMTTGITPRSPTVCCPPGRFVPSRACCPPGHVSMGGRLVLPPGGGGGQCCREDKVCGSGADITCCSTGSLAPELEGHCCNGRCVSLRFDAQNCGSCGRTCPAGQRCQDGACVPA